MFFSLLFIGWETIRPRLLAFVDHLHSIDVFQSKTALYKYIKCQKPIQLLMVFDTSNSLLDCTKNFKRFYRLVSFCVNVLN